ncbi:MAG: ABC-F family ATP-binding cassette domain-containing protein, partial [Acidimicrobiales bacterium]
SARTDGAQSYPAPPPGEVQPVPLTRYPVSPVAVLVDLQHVTVRRVDRDLFVNLSLTVGDGDRVGVVGINGAGKSTLLRLVAGVDLPSDGSVRRGSGARVGFLDQHPQLPPETVKAAVGEGWEAEAALDRLGMGAELDRATSDLSGGQAKRVALARVLSRQAELLVLDEPTNHLDLAAVAWLERWLLAFRGGLVLVTHDRHLLDRVTNRVLEIDRGHSYVHQGGYGSYLAARAEREDQAASTEASRRNLARRELAWLRRGPPARSRKPQARIDAAVKLIGTRPEEAARGSELDMAYGTPRLGNKVIECIGAEYRYDLADSAVVSGIGLVLDRRERLGIVGPNGAGKSTLLDLLAGRRDPTAGRVEVGPTVVVSYYDQRGIDLDPEARVQELVAGPSRSPGGLEDVALMERFWFTGELPFARVGTLSGGERRRLQLLLALASRPNVLFLDEPTNDLDLDTLRILEDFFEHWPGALVVVSHDRTFLDRTTERLVAMRADGTLAPVAGGVSAWVNQVENAVDAGPRRPASRRTDPVTAPTQRPGSSGPRGSAAPTARQLKEMEKQIAVLQRHVGRLADALGEAVDHAEMARVGSGLAEAQSRLEEAEERWLDLAEKAESER